MYIITLNICFISVFLLSLYKINNMKAKKCISQQELKSLFYYKDGNLIRKTTNKPIGTPTKVGQHGHKYLITQIKSVRYRVHRLIWIYFNGNFEDLSIQIDHIDNNTLNNKIENLRTVTNRINGHNRKDKSETFCIEALKYKNETNYRAYARVNSKRHCCQTRKTLEEAQADRDFIHYFDEDEKILARIQELKPSEP